MMNSTSRSLIVILFVPESACMGSLFIADTPINITKMVNCITLSRRERELKRLQLSKDLKEQNFS